jgi:hypothetical protein
MSWECTSCGERVVYNIRLCHACDLLERAETKHDAAIAALTAERDALAKQLGAICVATSLAPGAELATPPVDAALVLVDELRKTRDRYRKALEEIAESAAGAVGSHCATEGDLCDAMACIRDGAVAALKPESGT